MKPQSCSGTDSTYFWDEEEELIPDDACVPAKTTLLFEYKVNRFFLQGLPQRTLDVYKQKSISFHPWSDGKYYDWAHENRFLRPRGIANNDLETQENIQEWRKAVASINLSNLVILHTKGLTQSREEGYAARECVPLFKDSNNGNEYQLWLGSCGAEYACHYLSVVFCERHLQKSEDNASWEGYYRLREGQHGDLSALTTSPIPGIVFVLGCLLVRRKSKTGDGEYVAEMTDYTVFVDAGSRNELSLWIAAPRSELIERDRQCRERYPDIRCLPIFNGGMDNGQGGYDIACILPSIRQLATAPGEEGLDKGYKDACELVRQTRANFDPYLFVLSKTEVERITNSTPS